MKSLLLFIVATVLLDASICAQVSVPANFSIVNVASSWDQPMGTVFTSAGEKMFVWEKKGAVYVCTRNAQQLYDKQATPVLNIEPEVGNWGDHGLMSIALDPAFSATTGGYIYLLYVVDRRFLLNDNSIPADQGFAATIGRVTRYKVINSGGNFIIDPAPAERKILLGETKGTGIILLHDSHGLGTLVFAADGTLLISCGDGASYLTADLGSDQFTYYQQALDDGIMRPEENVGAFRSQMLNSHNGKILRIDPATGNGITSNPFYDAASPRAPKSRVWALGLRNPFRITVRPGSGSTNPAAADLGEIYVGDVGWNTWEELNILTEPGMNCGWPLFEGLTSESEYSSASVQNRDEPNPLAGSGCAAFLQFKQLLKQATADGVTTLSNPCSPFPPIPGTTANNRFFHRRPSLDWKHGQDVARVGIFSGNNAAVATIGTGPSNVTGSPFRGNSSTGGCWYTGTLFPPQYRNTYFHGDYGGQWLKSISVDFTDKVQQVQDFASGFGAIISITENPADGTIYCIDLGDNTVKRISYGGNQPPVVKLSADKISGPSALTVNFTGAASSDPEGGSLTYAWNFGDNTNSTSANPTHVFTASPGVPTKFVVKLTVKDVANATAIDSIIISVNNTAPVVSITSPLKNSTYRIGPDTSYTCSAVVTDAEHGPGQLKYKWQTFLRHNNHEHPAPIDTSRTTTTFLSRLGCNGDTYYYIIKLTVTDEAGLSSSDSSKIYPACAADVVVNGSVTLQGRPAQPNIRWQEPLTVDFYANGNMLTPVFTSNISSDANGKFTITGIPGAGTYSIAIKNSHSLQRVIAGKVLTAGVNIIDFGTLLEGDINNNNSVTLADISILLGTYNKASGNAGYDARADLNGDAVVSLADISLLIGNYNRAGETP